MEQDELRAFLDELSEQELLDLRQDVRGTPDGSLQEIHGVRVPKDHALRLINQALPVA